MKRIIMMNRPVLYVLHLVDRNDSIHEYQEIRMYSSYMLLDYCDHILSTLLYMLQNKIISLYNSDTQILIVFNVFLKLAKKPIAPAMLSSESLY